MLYSFDCVRPGWTELLFFKLVSREFQWSSHTELYYLQEKEKLKLAVSKVQG
jgi:hypothetical protein